MEIGPKWGRFCFSVFSTLFFDETDINQDICTANLSFFFNSPSLKIPSFPILFSTHSSHPFDISSPPGLFQCGGGGGVYNTGVPRPPPALSLPPPAPCLTLSYFNALSPVLSTERQGVIERGEYPPPLPLSVSDGLHTPRSAAEEWADEEEEDSEKKLKAFTSGIFPLKIIWFLSTKIQNTKTPFIHKKRVEHGKKGKKGKEQGDGNRDGSFVKWFVIQYTG